VISINYKLIIKIYIYINSIAENQGKHVNTFTCATEATTLFNKSSKSFVLPAQLKSTEEQTLLATCGQEKQYNNQPTSTMFNLASIKRQSVA
jgi:hypothetical protein